MNFEATLRFEDGFYTFVFTKIEAGNRVKYFVRTKTRTGENVFFEIVQEPDESWKMKEPVPNWIIAHEQDLIAVIQLNRT